MADDRSVVLVVDDEADVRDFIRTALKGEPYELHFTKNGVEGLAALDKVKPVLVLLDLKMPELDGLGVLERLRPSPDDPYAVIVLTAMGDDEEAKRCYDMGINFFLHKPFGRLELRGLVAQSIVLKKALLELAEKNQLISQQNQERKELLHVLCHDLTNSVGSVVSLLELSADEPDALKDSQEDIKNTLKGSLALIGLVRKIRALDDKRDQLRLEHFPLIDAVNEAVFIMNYKLTGKRVTLEAQVDEGILVQAERFSLIYTVLSNLLANAIKYSRPGSKVQIAAALADGRATLRITDHGIGIPAGQLADLFDLSMARSRPGTEGEVGTGFGMPLVKKFVAAYGGSIAVESRDEDKFPDDHGTEVTITFVGQRAQG